MIQDTVKCPKCGEVIKLSQAISQDIETALRQKLDKELDARLKTREEIVRREAQDSERVKLADLKSQLEEKTRRVRDAESAELDLRKKMTALEEKTRSLDLEIARRIDAERRQITEKALREADDAHRLKDAEKDKKLEDAKKELEEIRRRMEQGSQQTQGEVLELEMEARLKEEFPFDEIDPVEKGRKGGDVLHTVKTQTGRVCGKILWETKRTKDWSNSWLTKLREDQREAKADLGVLVSEALPKGFHHFREVDGVWVTDVPSALPLAVALRLALIKEEKARQAQTGKEGKMEVVYNYLTGVEFKNRVQAIMEAFVGMKQDLDAEKRAMDKVWSRREKNIEKVIRNIAGMHGELESMAGSLPAVKMLELPGADADTDAST